MRSLNIIGISGSLRKASTNTGLLSWAREHAPAAMNIELLDISGIPLFNADVEATGRPDAVRQMDERLTSADALLLACPEYNYCMAPALKNALDWASRLPGNAALSGKPVGIMGAGGGMGTSRAQYQLRQTCVYLNLFPLNKPEVFVNAFAGAFDAEGKLIDPKVQEQVSGLLDSLVDWSWKLRK